MFETALEWTGKGFLLGFGGTFGVILAFWIEDLPRRLRNWWRS